MKEIISLYKSGKQLNFRFFLAEILQEALMSQGLLGIPLIPIPPRKGKIRKTGWDQIDLLCKTMKQQYKSLIIRCLTRSDKVQQKTLNFAEREVHMKNTLKIKKIRADFVEYPRFILLDDVYTSGATLSAAAEKLSEVYGGEILALVLSTVL
ncbi:ComF family protein [Oceanispirochaeta crateris]|uniref:ComF family protein n=1 Tax=Oceanispirochaeta crateris TaxID=2518645 RepID=A0A5C1QHN5_9SPIO|nr:ComF family protein [Oceanispirochaeta crateris]QEN07655.1 ComF family protein [Oceanispirochaeta crateris]